MFKYRQTELNRFLLQASDDTQVFIENNGRRILKISFSFTLWPSELRKCQICEIKSSVSEMRSRVIV